MDHLRVVSRDEWLAARKQLFKWVSSFGSDFNYDCPCLVHP